MRPAWWTWMSMALSVPTCCMASWQVFWLEIMFIDGILRIIDHNLEAAEKVLKAIDKITENVEVVVTVSANVDELPEDLKKYVI